MPGYDPLELEGQIGGLHFSLGGPGVQEPGTPENFSFAIPTSLGTDSDGGDEDPPAEEEETWLHFAVGFIPVVGSARDAYESFRDGNYLMGAVNVGFTVFDIATLGVGGTGAKAILKGGVVGVKALAKAGLKETIETAAIKGFQAAKGDLDNIGGKLLSGGATAASKVASKWGSSSKLADNLAARNWPADSIEKAIVRHAGDNYTSWVTKTRKRIYENPTTGRQIVHDLEGGYSRIFQPNSIGSQKGTYLNMSGGELRPARVGAAGIHSPLLRDVDKGLWQQESHFFIEELLNL